VAVIYPRRRVTSTVLDNVIIDWQQATRKKNSAYRERERSREKPKVIPAVVSIRRLSTSTTSFENEGENKSVGYFFPLIPKRNIGPFEVA
jgi:hypothetical protein